MKKLTAILIAVAMNIPTGVYNYYSYPEFSTVYISVCPSFLHRLGLC